MTYLDSNLNTDEECPVHSCAIGIGKKEESAQNMNDFEFISK